MTVQNKIKLVYKGILLYTTIAIMLLFVAGLEDIFTNNFLFEAVCIIAVLLFACKKTISKEETDILTLSKFLKIDEL